MKCGITQFGKHEMTVNICGVIMLLLHSLLRNKLSLVFQVLSTTYVFITFKFWSLHADVITRLV